MRSKGLAIACAISLVLAIVFGVFIYIKLTPKSAISEDERKIDSIRIVIDDLNKISDSLQKDYVEKYGNYVHIESLSTSELDSIRAIYREELYRRAKE